MRLKDKIAIVIGAGQSPGEGLGNGRATVLRFAEEGAKVLAVDNNLSSAEETVAIARQAGGECVAFEADVAVEATLAAMVEAARRRWGRIDVLHYNVGVSIAGGDAPLDEITEPAFDRGFGPLFHVDNLVLSFRAELHLLAMPDAHIYGLEIRTYRRHRRVTPSISLNRPQPLDP